MKGAQAKYRTRLSSSTALAMLHCGGESDMRCGERACLSRRNAIVWYQKFKRKANCIWRLVPKPTVRSTVERSSPKVEPALACVKG